MATSHRWNAVTGHAGFTVPEAQGGELVLCICFSPQAPAFPISPAPLGDSDAISWVKLAAGLHSAAEDASRLAPNWPERHRAHTGGGQRLRHRGNPTPGPRRDVASGTSVRGSHTGRVPAPHPPSCAMSAPASAPRTTGVPSLGFHSRHHTLFPVAAEKLKVTSLPLDSLT